MQKPRAIFIVLLLLGVALFSIFKYLSALKEKNDLLGALGKIKTELSNLGAAKDNLMRSLQQEKALKQQLAQQNDALQENLIVYTNQLAQLEEDLVQAQNKLAELTPQFSILKAENAALQEERTDLKNQIIRFAKENEEYSARFKSIPELKKAIRDLKAGVRKTEANIRAKQKTAFAHDSQGNMGFIVRDGQSTYPVQVKIKVRPAWPQDGTAGQN